MSVDAVMVVQLVASRLRDARRRAHADHETSAEGVLLNKNKTRRFGNLR